jgi:dihydroneopterin aldolase
MNPPSTPPAADTIFLRGLEVECIIGFIEWERRVRQRVLIDFEIPCDCARAAATDEVDATIDYKKISKRIVAFVSASEFKLVETLAHRLALLLLAEFDLEWIRLVIDKPGAIRGSQDVGVAITRRRADLASAGSAGPGGAR